VSPVLIDGHPLGVAVNGSFSDENTDPIPGGRLWNGSGGPPGDLGAARAWNDMRAYIGAKHGVWIEPAGPASSARSIGQQTYFWYHQPPPAAPIGTSNHGWALAVDIATRLMAYYIRRYCRMFGFSFDEGDRVGEWWHVRYVGGYRRRVVIDPLTKRERRLLDFYDDAGSKGREHVRDMIAKQIRFIRRAATAEHDGWKKHDRAARYAELTRWFNEHVLPRYLTDAECALISSYYGADAAQKRRALRRINNHRLRVRDLARRGDWDAEHRAERFQYLSKFYDHRKAE